MSDERIQQRPGSTCETISVVSGKGGTGKSLILACVAYALQNTGRRVCLIDTDLGTQGLSLFLLGPAAVRGQANLSDSNSLYHCVQSWDDLSRELPVPKEVVRSTDHGMTYDLIVSNRQFYDKRLVLSGGTGGREAKTVLSESMAELSDSFRRNYRELVSALIDSLVKSGNYDYVLIDTRGGFGEMSLVPAVYSDTLLLVAEPDPTTFNQVSKLLTNIEIMAAANSRAPQIRGMLVNKAIDGDESKFRARIEERMRLIDLTWAIPLDESAIRAYKNQMIPFKGHDAIKFSLPLYRALTGMFDIVTIEWPGASKDKWNDLLVTLVDYKEAEMGAERQAQEAAEEKQRELSARLDTLGTRVESTIGEMMATGKATHVMQRDLSDAKGQLKSIEGQLHAVENRLREDRSDARKFWMITVMITLLILAGFMTMFLNQSQMYQGLKEGLDELHFELRLLKQ